MLEIENEANTIYWTMIKDYSGRPESETIQMARAIHDLCDELGEILQEQLRGQS